MILLSTLRLFLQNDPLLQPHRVEFLVVATELTRVVIAGCNLGAQGEHQHTDGRQPHEDTPAGREGKGRGGPGAGWALEGGLGGRESAFVKSKLTNG